MDTIFRVALCALLLSLGFVYCAEAPGLLGNESSQNISNTNPNSNNSNISSNTNDTTAKPTNSSGADVSPPSLLPDANGNSTTHLSPQPPAASSNHSSTVNTPPLSISNVTSTSPTPQTKTPSNHTTSNHSALLTPDSTAPSNHSTQTETSSITTVQKIVSPAATAQPTLRPSIGSSPAPPSTHPPAETSQTRRQTETPSKPQSTIGPLYSTSTQTKIHSESPSQLNTGGNAVVVHDPPAIDPLLAGLVSAFIVTAVIVTLLLFLKLRQRHRGPEFRRLQELPMDDMEDTPLYNY